MMRFIIYIAIGLVANFSYSQQLNAEVSEDQLLIGQPITVTYSVKTKSSDSILFVQQQNVIQARATTEDASLSSNGIEFEIREFTDTFSVNQQSKQWIGQYVITAWDSGVYILPGPTILIDDSNYVFNDLTIACHLIPPIDNVDLYDIKENYSKVPPKPFSYSNYFKEHWWWIALSLLAGVIFLVIMREKKVAKYTPIEKPVSLKDRTLIAIEALEEAKLWERDMLKEHFVELSYILRSYLTSRYSISLLEKTTYETTITLTKQGLDEETVNIIVRILSQADMVKFAKSKPDVIAILRVSTLAKQVVAETSPLEFDNVD